MMLVIAFLLNQTQILYPGNSPCLVIFKPPPLLVMFKAGLAFLILEVKPLLQHRLNIDWLSSRRTYLQLGLSDFHNFRVSAILGHDSLKVLMPFWKWLETSVNDIDKSSSSSSLLFWNALTDFFNLGLSFSRDFIFLEMDFIVLADFALAEDFSLSSSSAAFLQALMILV
jgi:hypothetical protein